jgi:hypothetical protein
MTAWLKCRQGPRFRLHARLTALALLCLAPQAVLGTSPDIRPRPARLLQGCRTFITQDAWNSMALFDVKDGRVIHRFPSEGWVRQIAVTADEKLLLVAADDGRLDLWDLNTGERRWQKQLGFGYLYDISFSGDGLSFSAGGDLGTAGVFETRTARLIRDVRVPGSSVMSVALTPDGSQGVFVDLGNRLHSFDVATGAVKEIRGGVGWPIRFSSDGKYLACSNVGLTRLRVLKVEAHLAHRDFGDFDDVRVIRPLKDGSFQVVGDPRTGSGVGARYLPERGELQTFKLPHDTGDFNPDCMLAVGTSWGFETELTDLKNRAVRLKIDNRANSRPPAPRHAPALGIAAILGIPVLLALVLLVLTCVRRKAVPGPNGRTPGG